MARSGQVTLRGRFPVGAVVTLTRVAGEHVLRPEGGEDVEVKTVEEEKGAPRVGFVRFTKGVEPGARYFIHGLNDGVPLQVRVTGRRRTIRRRCSSRRRSCRTGRGCRMGRGRMRRRRRRAPGSAGGACGSADGAGRGAAPVRDAARVRRIRSIRTSSRRSVGRRTCRRARSRCRTPGRVRSTVCRSGVAGRRRRSSSARSARRTSRRACSSGRRRRGDGSACPGR
jgi:hypothetical protein